MEVPYECPPQGPLIVSAGTPGCFAIDFPPRSKIKKVVVVQTGGDREPFTVDLFNRQSACEGGSVEASDGDATADLPSRLFKVLPTVEGRDGVAELFVDNDGYGFYSQDPQADNRQGMQPRRLYLRIASGIGVSGGDRIFTAIIGCITQHS